MSEIKTVSKPNFKLTLRLEVIFLFVFKKFPKILLNNEIPKWENTNSLSQIERDIELKIEKNEVAFIYAS